MKWEEKGGSLTKKFDFDDFAEALAFVNQVGELAEEHSHHPDIKFGWGYVEISLTSHDAGGVTDRDHKLAEAISRV